MKYDITDFSAKDSKEYNESTSLYENALDEADNDLMSFKETRFCKGDIPTKLAKKTHNSPDFLDEEKIKQRKMNADTNATAELVGANINEALMFGATEEDLENELIDGGLGKDVLEVFKNHNITGKAIWDSLTKLKTYIGADPNIDEALNSVGSAEDSNEDESADTEEVADESSEDETSEETSDENVEESTEAFPTNLEEMVKSIRHKIAEKNLRNRYLKESDDDCDDEDCDNCDFDEDYVKDWVADAVNEDGFLTNDEDEVREYFTDALSREYEGDCLRAAVDFAVEDYFNFTDDLL